MIKPNITLTLLLALLAARGSGQVAAAYIAPNANMTVHGNMSVWGDMTNSANATQSGSLNIKNGARVSFYGSAWTNSNASNIGGDAGATGEVDFAPRPAPYAGAFAQALNGGGENQSFPSLRISNPMNVNLNANPSRVRGTLTFAVDDGHIISNGNNLVLGDGAAAPGNIVGYNPLRYFVTNQCGTGHFVRNGFNNAARVFPIGMAENDYTPALVAPAAGMNRVSANVCNYTSSASVETQLMSGGINRTWNIFADVAGNASLTLQHNRNTNNSGGGGPLVYADTNAFIVQSTLASLWQDYVMPQYSLATGNLQDGGAPITNTAMHTRTYALPISAGTLTAYFTKDIGLGPLPVSDLQFTGRYSNGYVNLTWKALQERELAYYELTRSTNGVNFAPVNRQQAANAASASYVYADDVRNLGAGKLYYRLRTADKNGDSKLSNIVLINLSRSEVVTIYPNPAVSQISISLTLENAQPATITLYNMTGQAVKTMQTQVAAGAQTLQLSGLEKLASGQYELVIRMQDGRAIQEKVMIRH